MKNGQSILKILSIVFGLAGAVLASAGALVMALVSKLRLFAGVFCLVGCAFLLTALICYLVYQAGANKKAALLEAGTFVYAQITEIEMDVRQEITVDQITMHPYFILCRYVDAHGREYHFKSRRLLYNPSGLLLSDQIKVYVDLNRPGRYYVDTNEILPETAVLHKFKRSSEKNAENLIAGGKYITAKMCGVELIGMIKLGGIVTQRFLKLSEKMVRQMGLQIDEKGRVYAGYTILCKYTAKDGTIHVFASKCIRGEPKRPYIGGEVSVYYDGEGYRNYHVAAEGMKLS